MSQALLESLGEGLDVGVVICDPDFRLQFWNRAAPDLLGAPAAMFALGRPLADILAGSGEDGRWDPAAVVQEIDRATRSGPHRWVHRRSPSATIWVSARRTSHGNFVLQIAESAGGVLAPVGNGEAQAALVQAQQLARLGYYRWSRSQHRLIAWNGEYRRILGQAPDSSDTSGILPCLHPDDRERVILAHRAAEAEGRAVELEFRILHPDGSVRFLRDLNQPEPNPVGPPDTWFGTMQDITDLKQREFQLRQNEVMLQQAASLAKLAYYQWSIREGRYLQLSHQYFEVLGLPPDVPLKRVDYIDPYLHPEDRERMLRERRLAEVEGRRLDLQYRILRPDGGVRHIHEMAEIRPGPDGPPDLYSGTLQDVSDFKQREAELTETRMRLAEAARLAKLVYWRWDCREPSHAFAFTWGEDSDDFIGLPAAQLPKNVDDWLRLVHPADIDRVLASYRAIEAAATSYQLDYRLLRPDGQVIWVHEIGEVERRDGEQAISYVGTLQNITDLKSMEAALQESEVRFRTMADTVPALVWMRNEQGAYTFFNKPYLEFTGRSLEEEIASDFMAEIHPDDREAWQREATFEASEPKRARSLEYRLRGGNMQYRWFYDLWRPRFDGHGRYLGDIGVLVDVTERKRMEEELRQSQKMQSIGTLAGGIAHSLNNLLVPILGFIELTMEEFPPGSRQQANLAKAVAAGEQAKQLVQQILAFSRREQAQRRLIKPAALVEEILSLLRSVLPESVEIRHDIDNAAPAIMADATELYQVFLNLASNAAAAMGMKGGVFAVRVAPRNLDAAFCTAHPELAPGPFVELAVSDTGCGIANDVLGRIFEPFFTTKEVGDGTGLGLSVVHGIVSTYRGTIVVETTLQRGTTFIMYLPAL
jgi:PAS domain S-box-containing protein